MVVAQWYNIDSWFKDQGFVSSQHWHLRRENGKDFNILAVVFSTGKWYSNETNKGSSVVEPLTHDQKIKGLIPVDTGILEEKMADFSIFASVSATGKW